MTLTEICNNVYLYKDYVNVYAITREDRAILIDFGSGNVLDSLSEIGINKVDYIFHTHYHRDQCFGDNHALEQKIKIAAPFREHKLFSEAENFWISKSYYNTYILKPTFFVSTYNIPLDLLFNDGDSFDWEDYQFKILQTVGHTKGSTSYLVDIDNNNFAFTGDLIHSGGKVITYYDLQYVYGDNGEGGIIPSFESFDKLLKNDPFILLPSHGDIIRNPRITIDSLREKFSRARTVYGTENASIAESFSPELGVGIPPVDLKQEFPSVFHRGFSPPFMLKGKNQNCILIDFAGSEFFGYTETQLTELLERFNIKTIDFIIPTHYHDDHTAGFPLLQKKWDIKVYALENMVDILENPTHYRMGCLIETPIKVDRILKDGEILKWDDYEFKVYHFPGQTEFHMGLFGNIDGKSVFFTGDSLSPRMFSNRHNNLICVNLCQLGKDVGYMKCADILLECNPEYIAISHHGIIKVNRDLLEKYKEIISKYESLASEIIAQENPNMGYDPNWISFKPIRVITKPGSRITTNLLVRNYLNKKASIKYKLNLPSNWSVEVNQGELLIEPKTFKKIPLAINIPQKADPMGRTIITANIVWNGNNIGPFPDLMIDHGFNPSESWSGWTPDNKQDLLSRILKQFRNYSKLFR